MACKHYASAQYTLLLHIWILHFATAHMLSMLSYHIHWHLKAIKQWEENPQDLECERITVEHEAFRTPMEVYAE